MIAGLHLNLQNKVSILRRRTDALKFWKARIHVKHCFYVRTNKHQLLMIVGTDQTVVSIYIYLFCVLCYHLALCSHVIFCKSSNLVQYAASGKIPCTWSLTILCVCCMWSRVFWRSLDRVSWLISAFQVRELYWFIRVESWVVGHSLHTCCPQTRLQDVTKFWKAVKDTTTQTLYFHACTS